MLQSFWGAVVLAHLSGLLLSLSHPTALPLISVDEGYLLHGSWQWVLAFIGMIPFLYASEKLKGIKRFAVAMVMAASYFYYGIYWINISLNIYGMLPLVLSMAVCLVLVLYVSLYWAAAFHLSAWISERLRLRVSLTLPVCLTAMEILRNYVFTGFSWHNIAYSQYNNPPILQSASVWGVYGLTFLIALVNAVMYELWRTRRVEGLRPVKVPLLPTVIFLVLTLSYGGWRLATQGDREADASVLDIAVVQGNIEQGIKNLSAQHADAIREIYIRLSDQVPEEVDLVIWPEAAYPWSIPYNTPNMSIYLDWPDRQELPWRMIVGVPVYERLRSKAERLEWGDDTKYYNSAMLLDRNYDVQGLFKKSHLVPFSEYVPKFFKTLLGIKQIIPNTGSFDEGAPGSTLDWDGIRAGVLICFEGVFPEVTRAYAGNGADFLINLTNDAWFGASSMLHQHLAMYAFRAVESGKYLVRGANTGVSAFFSPTGDILTETRPYTRTIVRSTIKRLHNNTAYGLVGDLPAWGCCLIAAIWLGMAWRRRKDGGK